MHCQTIRLVDFLENMCAIDCEVVVFVVRSCCVMRDDENIELNYDASW